MGEQEIFYDDNNYYNLEEVKQFLFNDNDMEEYECIEDVSDNDAWDYIHTMKEADWQDTKDRLINAAQNAPRIIAKGNLGLWYGTAEHMMIADNIEDMIYKILGRDCEPYQIYTEDGELHFIAEHHDGRNDWIIRGMYPQGNSYYNNWSYYDYENPDCDLSEPEIYANIFENNEYSFPLQPVW